MTKILTIAEFWGRFGNNLWEIAGLFGLAKKYGYTPRIPASWPYREYFNIPDEYFATLIPDTVVTEKQYHYDPLFLNGIKANVVGIRATLQSYLYWWDIRDTIREYLTPKNILDFGQWSVGVHIRRGDYVKNPAYVQYDADYYRGAMKKYFTDPRYMFYIISDDYDYIMREFPPDATHILDKRSEVEDFLVLCSCKHHIMSGSSFSFWSTFAAQDGGMNIRVPRTHAGHLAHLDESASYMPDWKINDGNGKIILTCYADEKYKKFQDRLIALNNKEKQFDATLIYDRKWLEKTDFYKKNKKVLNQERGSGYWLWKPYLILESLKMLTPQDILVYMDAGDVFFGNIRKFLFSEMDGRHIMLTEGGNIQKDYTKRDCFIEMDCDGDEYWNAKQIEAGFIAVRNTSKARKVLQEWLDWCCTAHVVDDSPNVKGDNFPTFIDHRHDQSILTNIMVSHNLYASLQIREYVACNVDEIMGRVDLSDVTWIIPVRMDSQDRQENLEIVLDWLQARFETNIIVGEQGSDHYFQYVEKRGITYMYFDMEMFHRTRMLNLMTVAAKTNIIINHDADVILTAQGVVEAVKMLKEGNPIVYPYSGAFLRTPKQYHAIIHSTNSADHLTGMKFSGWSDASKGGSVGFLRDKYMAIGGENENFYSHAPEDVERYRRSSMFYNIKRVGYPLFHLDHFIGPNSHHAHDWAAFNNSEWRRVKERKNKEDMMRYIESWPWYKEHRHKLGL